MENNWHTLAREIIAVVDRLAKVTDGQIPWLEAKAQSAGLRMGFITEYVSIARSFKAGQINVDELGRQVVALVASHRKKKSAK